MDRFGRFLIAASALVVCSMLTLPGGALAQGAQIKIGTEGTYKPYSFFTSGGELTGFDVELVQAICAAAKLDCVMVTMDYDGMVPALNEKKLDAIASGMTITEKRKKTLAFTDRIRSSGKHFVTCAPDKFTDTSPEALKGHIVGTQTGTTNADYFQALYTGSDIRLYKTMDEAFQDLAAGRLDLVLAQEGPAYDFANSSAGKGCKLVGARLDDPKYFGEGVGIAFRQSDTDLVAAFNAGIKQVLADGTYKKLNDKYFSFSLY